MEENKISFLYIMKKILTFSVCRNTMTSKATVSYYTDEVKTMDNYVITINRQFGSLGRPIAKKMSEILQIKYYDRDIVDAVAKETNLPVSIISDQEESAKSGFFYMKFPLGSETNAMQDNIYETQRKIIANIADRESCIIVGRCSDYVLRNHPNLIRIFIYASYEKRLRNCIDNLHMTKDSAQKMIADVDKARNAYHMRYAKTVPSDINHNDLMIDSSILGIDGTAAYLADFVQQKLSLRNSVS